MDDIDVCGICGRVLGEEVPYALESESLVCEDCYCEEDEDFDEDSFWGEDTDEDDRILDYDSWED